MVGGPGSTVLLYRYTVTGSDKASIDTGVDTPDAGSNDWTNGDLLEIRMITRTDDAGATSNIEATVNNDTGSNYDQQAIFLLNTTFSNGPNLGFSNWPLHSHGSGGEADTAACSNLDIPDYAGTVFHKLGFYFEGRTDTTAANNENGTAALGWRNTAAITRFKLSASGSAKLKVGSQLLIYKRLAS